MQRLEQEKATAFRQGQTAFATAFKAAGEILPARVANPYEGDPAKEHQATAWNRGWDAERRLRMEVNPRERSSR